MQLPRQDLTHLFIDFGSDWSSKAVITALEKKGVSLQELEEALGIKKNSIRNVFYRPCDRYETVIAGVIGVEPSVIWPSRYQQVRRLSA